MKEEWLWAVAICALPFLAFGALQLVAIRRRHRSRARAQRRKSPRS